MVFSNLEAGIDADIKQDQGYQDNQHNKDEKSLHGLDMCVRRYEKTM